LATELSVTSGNLADRAQEISVKSKISVISGLVALAWLAVPLSPLSGAESLPADRPVAVDDNYDVYISRVTFLDVAANDTDPNGAPLTACRVGTSSHRYLHASLLGGKLRLLFLADSGDGDVGATPGKVATIDYYVCNQNFLSRGTVTVTARGAIPPTVTKTSEPGRLRVENPNEGKLRCDWGQPDKYPGPLGSFTVGPSASNTFKVTTRYVDWTCYWYRSEFWPPVATGRVTRISLP
jgi:hypothetical protein